MTKKTKKTPTSKVDYEAMPPHPMEGPVTDRRAQFRTLTRSAPVDRASERAFLASKLTMLRVHPGLTQRERAEGEAMLALVFGTKAKKKTPPVPGGVGYGMFYKGAFAGPSPVAHRSPTRSSARIRREETLIPRFT